MMVLLPNNQKAVHTLGSAASKMAFRRDFHIAQEDEGVPGNGSISSLRGL